MKKLIANNIKSGTMKIKRLFVPVLFFGVINSCIIATPKEYKTYSEPKEPKPVELALWNSVPEGIQATVGSIDERYEKRAVPETDINYNWEGTAWKGEKVNAQFLLWTTETLKQVNLKASDLKDDKGNTIEAKNVSTFFVRYVMTDEFGDKPGGCGPRKAADFDSSLVADVLDPIPYFDIEANSTRPVWVTINIPDTTEPGIYSGTITVNAEQQQKVVFTIRLRVQDKALPKASDWKFHLDLWQNPFAVARYNNVKLWSQQHFDLLRPLMKMLADAGQKCITATIMHKPWGGQTYDHYESLIEWRKSKNAIWTYDYSAFDKWVEFAMDCGIAEQINCYTMIPWGNQFTYFDELTNKDSTFTALAGTKQYEDLWTPFLQKFTKHLEEKGWQNITTIAMDERELEDMQKMIAFIKSVAPKLKITLAGGYHEEINDDLFDLCVASRYNLREEDITQRSEKGFHTTFYVCCVEPYPNNFTFSPPDESAYMGWYAAAKGYDGFLRWAYNSWVKDPLIDSRFRAFPAGDTYLVYPGSRSSIRFERLREGIQDFEKIRILRSELIAENCEEARIKLNKLDDVLSKFEISTLKDTPAKVFVNNGKKTINYLSEN